MTDLKKVFVCLFIMLKQKSISSFIAFTYFSYERFGIYANISQSIWEKIVKCTQRLKCAFWRFILSCNRLQSWQTIYVVLFSLLKMLHVTSLGFRLITVARIFLIWNNGSPRGNLFIQLIRKLLNDTKQFEEYYGFI